MEFERISTYNQKLISNAIGWQWLYAEAQRSGFFGSTIEQVKNADFEDVVSMCNIISALR